MLTSDLGLTAVNCSVPAMDSIVLVGFSGYTLESLEKFVWWGWVCKPILVFNLSLSQAEQLGKKASKDASADALAIINIG